MNEWRDSELGPEFNARLAALCEERRIDWHDLARACHMIPDCMARILTARHILTRHMYLRLRSEIEWITKEPADESGMDQSESPEEYPNMRQTSGPCQEEIPGPVFGVPGEAAMPVLPPEEGEIAPEVASEEGERA